MLKKLCKITTFPPIHQISPKLFFYCFSVFFHSKVYNFSREVPLSELLSERREERKMEPKSAE